MRVNPFLRNYKMKSENEENLHFIVSTKKLDNLISTVKISHFDDFGILPYSPLPSGIYDPQSIKSLRVLKKATYMRRQLPFGSND